MYVSDLLKMYRYCSTFVIYLIVILEYHKHSRKTLSAKHAFIPHLCAVCLAVGNLVKNAKQFKKKIVKGILYLVQELALCFHV